MTVPFAIISALTIASAVAAMSLRNLIHCALALTVTLAGLAAVYLQLDAQFVGFAQILVYIGAVAILIVVAILLTRSGEEAQPRIFSSTWAVGVGIAVLVFGVLAAAVSSSRALATRPPLSPQATIHQIGDKLMSQYVLPLEVVGLLLTAALIGAVMIALREKEEK